MNKIFQRIILPDGEDINYELPGSAMPLPGEVVTVYERRGDAITGTQQQYRVVERRWVFTRTDERHTLTIDLHVTPAEGER